MAINSVAFTGFEDVDLPTADTDLYTSPALTKAALLSVIFSNKTTGVVNVTVKIVRTGGAPVSTVVKDAPIPVGGALDIIENKPIILSAGDKLQGACTTGGASAVDVTGSVLEAT